MLRLAISPNGSLLVVRFLGESSDLDPLAQNYEPEGFSADNDDHCARPEGRHPACCLNPLRRDDDDQALAACQVASRIPKALKQNSMFRVILLRGLVANRSLFWRRSGKGSAVPAG